MLARQWWADALVNGGLSVRPDVERNPFGLRRRGPREHSHETSDHCRNQGECGVVPLRSCRDHPSPDV